MKPTAGPGRALLLVSHTTRLRYAEPVVEAHSEVRKTPTDTAHQRVLTHKLEVEPPGRPRRHVDYFGSHVYSFSRLEPHRALVVRAESVVETRDPDSGEPAPADDPRPWRQRLAEFLHWSPAVPPLTEYGQIDHAVDVALDAPGFLAALRALGTSFASRFRYDPDATDVHSSPRVLFEGGGGVCQDLAHGLIGVLRAAGVPSRYVSGYVYDPDGDDDGEPVRGSRASHAWAEVWHPELGWRGIDPTNDRLVDWQYVRVAAGRDYSDVQPLRGVFLGPREQELEVEVRVERVG